MEEADSLFQGKVGFLLFFQPKSVKEMGYLFIRDRFDYPLFMDTGGEINALNHFPQAQQYQCFLLDSNNKALMIGNPVLNQKIWELYEERISNKTVDVYCNIDESFVRLMINGRADETTYFHKTIWELGKNKFVNLVLAIAPC